METNTNTVTEPAAGAAAEAAAVKPPAGETAEKAPSAASAESTAAKSPAEGRTYDQSYIEKLLAEQKAARDEAVAEALKVAGMDADSKAAYEKQQEEKKLAEREADIALRELKADARELLAEKEVPAEFLDMLVGKDMEATRGNVEAFKKQFDAAVQAQVEKRLAGKTPSGGSGASAASEDDAMAAEIAKYMV